jgi:hypothetical protein
LLQSFFEGNPKFFDMIGEMMIATIRNLERMQLEEYQTELIALVKDIIVSTATLSDVAQKAMLSFPSFNPEALQVNCLFKLF